MLERSLPHVDTFIALSEFSRDKHREFGFPRDMEVLPPIVFDADADAIDAPVASPHPRPYFFYAGRLEAIKGLDDVVPLFRESDAPADLLIAGAGSHEPALRALAGDSPRIRFLGQRRPDRLAPLYRHAMAHIAPSVCFETFGNTLVEVVSPKHACHRETHWAVPGDRRACRWRRTVSTTPRTFGARSSASHRIVHFRDRLGAAGRRAYEATWSEEAIVPRYLEIVERTMARRFPNDIDRPGGRGQRTSTDARDSHVPLDRRVGLRDLDLGVRVSAIRSRGWRAAMCGWCRSTRSCDMPSDANAVALTFDDGFVNFGDVAAPLLADHGMPSTLFVVTDAAGKTNRWPGSRDRGIPELPLLGWDALGRLAEQGVEIGAHTRTHAELLRLTNDRVHDEVVGGAERIRSESWAMRRRCSRIRTAP